MALTLREIWIYPVKSLAGVRVRRARVEDRGLEDDRRFMIVDAKGRFLTQRQHPRMASMRATIEADALVLHAASDAPLRVLPTEGDEREVIVWDDRVTAIDAGDEAARFIDRALGTVSARLVRMPERTRRPADPEHARPGDLVSFADGFPFLLVTDGSLATVNERLELPIDARRFRPNLVIAGADPFAEDSWREIDIGPIRFFPRKPCGRCEIVDVDPDTGQSDGRVLSVLASFREVGNRVLFGQNLVHDGHGTIEEAAEVAIR
jgi:uncharacterized protein YcbX